VAVSRLEFATETREELERMLTTPVQGWVVATGQQYEAPPIYQAFHLEAVKIDSSEEYPRLIVKFRWDGESDVFAVSYRVDPDDDDFNWGEGASGFAMSIKVELQEKLMAVGYTLANAIRERRDGLVWVRWNRRIGASTARLLPPA
jgi:hypothetical protein